MVNFGLGTASTGNTNCAITPKTIIFTVFSKINRFCIDEKVKYVSAILNYLELWH